MPDYLVAPLFFVALGILAWFIAPAYARGMTDIWYPSIGEKGFGRLVWLVRAAAALFFLEGLAILVIGATAGG